MSNGGLTTRWASPPGDTIQAVMLERTLPSEDVAAATGLTDEEFDKLLAGDLNITLALARSLSEIVGATAAFWLTREAQYRDDLERVLADDWSKGLPLKQMSEFGWIEKPASWQDRIAKCLDYFDVPNVAAWDATYAAEVEGALFRTSHAFEHETIATAVWFRACELEARKVDISVPFDRDQFRRAMIEIRPLTREPDPRRFIPALSRACAEAGVYLTVVRAPKGCTASGATRIHDGRPLIALSARHLSDDHFWFTFYHEGAHAFAHELETPFIDTDDASTDLVEQEANQIATSLLLGDVHLDSRPRSYRQVISIAQSAGVSPGIVVGQLQHQGLLSHNEHNSLKRRFTWNGVSLERARTR